MSAAKRAKVSQEESSGAVRLEDLWGQLMLGRRHLHMNPEPGFKEHGTVAWVREQLQSLAGIANEKIKQCTPTGLVVDIHGTGPEAESQAIHCIALRADMDALEMTEENANLPYRSSNEGIAHMCGHDGHTICALGTAVLLQQRADQIPKGCTVRLLFQPAEEQVGGGAKFMVEEGCLEGVEEVYGQHNWPNATLGTMRLIEGPVMANETMLEIEIKGAGGHGSQPHAATDPVLAACQVVTALQSVVSRNVHCADAAVVSVTTIQGGELWNVIPDTVKLTGTTRSLSKQAQEIIEDRIPKIAQNTSFAFGCSCMCKINQSCPAIVNHPVNTKAVLRAAERSLGPLDQVASGDELPMMAADDFAVFAQERPGCYFFMGGKEDCLNGQAVYEGGAGNTRSNSMIHCTDYDFNDNLIRPTCTMFVRIVEDRLKVNLYTDEELPVFGQY